MSDLPSKLTGTIAPTPEQSQEQFRAFLRRVAEEVFDGNVKRMAKAVFESVGYDWDEGGDNFRRKLGRIMRGPKSDPSHGTDRVDPDIVEWTWKYLFQEYGMNAFDYAPDLLGSRLLPVVFLSPEPVPGESGPHDRYEVVPEIADRYSIDKAELVHALSRTDHRRFVTIIESDLMEPSFRSGDRVIIEHVPKADQIMTPGIYLFRLEGAIQIARLQPKPGHVVQVLFENGEYDNYEVDLTSTDAEVLGRVWGHFTRV